MAEETSPVAGASGLRRGKGEAAVTAPAAAPKKKRGRGRRVYGNAAEQPICEQGEGDVQTPAAGTSVVNAATIISLSPGCG